MGDDDLGSSVTRDDGTFTIEFNKAAFKKPTDILDKEEPEVYLKIYDQAGNPIKKTEMLTKPKSSSQEKEGQDKFEVIVLAELIGEGGTTSLSTPFWDPNDVDQSSTIVLHPLGGCIMGKDNTQGVVNSFGEVYDCSNVGNTTETYQGLYVVDGAIIPTALGVNSSLTISALAFRIAKNSWDKNIYQ